MALSGMHVEIINFETMSWYVRYIRGATLVSVITG